MSVGTATYNMRTRATAKVDCTGDGTTTTFVINLPDLGAPPSSVPKVTLVCPNNFPPIPWYVHTYSESVLRIEFASPPPFTQHFYVGIDFEVDTTQDVSS